MLLSTSSFLLVPSRPRKNISCGGSKLRTASREGKGAGCHGNLDGETKPIAALDLHVRNEPALFDEVAERIGEGARAQGNGDAGVREAEEGEFTRDHAPASALTRHDDAGDLPGEGEHH